VSEILEDKGAVQNADPRLLDLAMQASYQSEDILLKSVSNPKWGDRWSKWESFVPCGLRDCWIDMPIRPLK
jgi:hypothetical protein